MPRPTRGPECVYSKRTISYSNGWVGVQKWKMGGENVDSFIAANVMTPYPGTTNLRPQQFDVEPLADGQTIVLPDGTPEYALVTVSYALDFLDTPWPRSIPRPYYPPGTTLKLSAKASGQFLMLPTAALVPAGTDERTSITVNGEQVANPNYGKALAGAGNEAPNNGRVLIPLIDFELEWDRIPGGESLTFDKFIGCVNKDSYMGAPPGTLLCEGPKLDPSYTLNTSQPWAHKVVLTLKCRLITVGDNIYGWNHDYVKDKGWVLQDLLDFSQDPPKKVPRYTSVDFENLLAYGL